MKPKCKDHHFACDCRERIVKRIIYLALYEQPTDAIRREIYHQAFKLYSFNGIEEIKRGIEV